VKTAFTTAPGEANSASQVISTRVVHKERLTHDIVELTLVAASGGPLPAWEPGAHIDLVLGDGLVRQHSRAANHRILRSGMSHPAGGGVGIAPM
jgi:NAD(P)H-flavin reductase